MNQQVTYQYNREYQPREPGYMDRRINWGVLSIIIICVAMLIWMYVDLDSTALLWMWPDSNLRVWQFVTSIFLHGGFEHLFWNMFMLYMFGMALENLLRTKNFLMLFIISGILGNIGYVLFCVLTGSDMPAVGASGALYGIFACLVVLMPNMRVYLFFMIPMKIVHALLLFAAFDIVFLGANDSVAHAAHLAGLVGGLAFGLYFKKRIQRPQPRIAYRYDNIDYR